MEQEQARYACWLRSALYTVIVYGSLFLLAVAVYSWVLRISIANSELSDFSIAYESSIAESMLIVFIVGVAGVIPMMGSSATMFLFPFSPLVAALSVIFILVFLLERKRLISDHKKIFFSCIASVGIFFLGTMAYGFFSLAKEQKRVNADRQHFAEKYETNDPVTVEGTFIYPEKGSIFLSGANGEDKKNLFSSSFENIGYVSPGGTYYIECEPYGEYGKCKTLKSRNDENINIDMCVMKSQRNGMICPNFCQWNSDGSRLVCEYEAAGLIAETTLDLGRALVYFNPATGAHKIIASKENPEYDSGFDTYIQDFAFVSNNSILYADKDAYYRIDDMDVARKDLKSVPVTNLTPCQGFIVNDGKLVCPVDAEKIGIPISDQDNYFVKDFKTVLISQSLDQSRPDDFVVITKAPQPQYKFMFQFGSIIIYHPSLGAMKIVDPVSGKARDFGGDYARDISIESDESLVFENDPSSFDKKTIPIPFRPEGDNVAPRGVVESDDPIDGSNTENAKPNMVKFENDKISFTYDSNNYMLTNTRSSVINLKDVASGSYFAAVGTYKIENGLTYDMIYNSVMKMGCADGYCDISKVKIGNREFIKYTLRSSNGIDASIEYETVIGGKYHLQIGENLIGHKHDAASAKMIEELISSVWVKTY